jgi:orotidine-5'-phosphate decarboxylase
MKKFKIFIACDSQNVKQIEKILKETKHNDINFGYKFGLEFLNSKNGRIFISKLKNKIIFGDYKLSDIPNTCAAAIKAVRDLKFNYITIHTNCGLNALKAAKKVAGKSKLIGVTTLTSLDKTSLKEIGYNNNLQKVILNQANLARKANLDAIVCSPKEVKLVKKVFKKEIITPGIRFDSKKYDQKRVLTPRQAYENGSDWLVIGRPITQGNIRKNIQKLVDHLYQ